MLFRSDPDDAARYGKWSNCDQLRRAGTESLGVVGVRYRNKRHWRSVQNDPARFSRGDDHRRHRIGGDTVDDGGLQRDGALSRRNDDPQRASRPFDKNRDGFVAGEGSAVLILESESHAKARGAKIYGEVLGYGLTDDAFHISAPAENGAGAAICMKNALADAGLAPNQVDYLNAHGTSTQLNDKSETAAVKTVFGEHAYEMVMSSTKSMHGHLLGAAGALEAIICLKAMQENLIPPTINYETRDPICDLDYVPNTARSKTLNRVMSNSFGFGGHNASIIFGKYG